MKWIKFIAFAGLLAMAGCSGQTNQVVQNWAITNSGTNFAVQATLDPSYEINGEALIPFKNYGTVSITQANNGQSIISASLNVNSFLDSSLTTQTMLPNHEPFPSIVTGPMLASTILQNSQKWDISVYFSRQVATPANPARTLFGIDIANWGVGTNFGSITLTQNYFNKSNYKFASITFYGPVVDPATNKVTVPGGIFLVADISAFTPSAERVARVSTEIGGRDAYKYATPQARQQLMTRVFQALQKAGVIVPKN